MNDIVWGVLRNEDLTEGRGRRFISELCVSSATAARLAKGRYVQGADCPVEKIEVKTIEGIQYVPLRLFQIIPPSDEDLVLQRKQEKYSIAIEKARNLGMTDEEIAVIQYAL